MEGDVGRAVACNCNYTHVKHGSERVTNGWAVPWMTGAGSLQCAGRAERGMFWARNTDDGGTSFLAASDDGRTFWNLHLPEHVRGSSSQNLSKFRFVDNGVKKGEYHPVALLVTVVGNNELRISRWNLLDSSEWELTRAEAEPS